MELVYIFSWLFLSLLTFLAIIWLWTKYSRTYTHFNIPPFPVKPWPIVGHFFMISGDMREKMKTWRKKAGDIYSLDIGGQLQILVNDYHVIKEILVKHADNITNVQRSYGNDILGEHNKGIFAARDDNWKEQRTTSLSILRYFGMGKNIMADKIQEEVACVLDKLDALKGRPEDVRLLLNVGIANVICSVAVGERFDHEDTNFATLVLNIRHVLKYIRYVAILTPCKYLAYLPGDIFHVKKWAKASINIDEKFSKVYINKLRDTINESEEPQNFVSAYIREMKKLQKKGVKSNLDESNLIPIVRTLFLAGTETTSTTILWCLLFMLHNPEVQEKVYQEIEANVGTARTPNMADKPKLTYLNAVIMETQRRASLVPVASLREVNSPFVVRGFTFPKGSTFWPILDSVHYDKKIWGDPDKFRPERFIDQNGALINREELMPFNTGRRACLGESLARMELFLFLSGIFHRFRFEPADSSRELPTLKESFGTTVAPQPFQIRFIARK